MEGLADYRNDDLYVATRGDLGHDPPEVCVCSSSCEATTLDSSVAPSGPGPSTSAAAVSSQLDWIPSTIVLVRDSGLGIRELAIGNWELGIGNWERPESVGA